MTLYSHSRLSAFENCQRQYWYRYIKRPDIERERTVEAFLGNLVHDALEELYKQLLNGRLTELEELLAWYKRHWDRGWREGVRIVKHSFTSKDYYNVGQDSLRKYYRRYHPFDQSQTLQLENRIQIDLDGDGKYCLQGYIDRLSRRADDTYEIHDYKTSAHLPTQDEADTDRQLGLYQLGVQGMWNDVQEVDLIWHYMRFDKEIRSRHSLEQLEATKRTCINTINDIESLGRNEAEFPTHPSRLCEWCDFRLICPATRHYVATEILPPAQFKADAGVRLVDTWSTLRDRRSKLTKEADALKVEEQEIKNQLIDYATQYSLESVTGSSYSARVTEKHAIDCPKSNDEDRAALEDVIRRAGFWDDVSSLSISSLEKVWRDDSSLSPEVRQFLSAFIKDKVETSVSLRRQYNRTE